MTETQILQLEALLNPLEMQTLHQWATVTSQGGFDDRLSRTATYIVIGKLWPRFDPDEIDLWLDELVETYRL